jgi:GNAT superfamily N-acetyltransferase
MDSAASYPLTTLAELFTAGFAGYVIPMRMTPEDLAERVASEDIDLAASRVVLRDDIPVGLGLVSRRGWQSRVAAMGIRSEARGHGFGWVLLQRLLQDARVRGDRRMRLEVFESNAPARALYERGGFRASARLVGYEHLALAPAEMALEPVDPATFARHLSAVRGILTLPAHRRRGAATHLLKALAAQFPGVPLSVPPLLPAGLGEPFWSALGFSQSALTLLEMVLDVASIGSAADRPD